MVVEQRLADALPIVSFLAGCHFHVTVADTFADAKMRMAVRPPALLITEVRLGEYNGLELVLRGKSRRPDMAAIVVSTIADSVLQVDAEGMGATFVLKPTAGRELRAATFRTMFERTQSPEGTPIRAPFERRHSDRRDFAGPTPIERRIADRRRDFSTLLAAASRAIVPNRY